MSFRHTIPFALAGALALAMAAGCGDDGSPAGNGGTSSNTLSIPSGSYSASGAMFVCGETVPFEALVDTVVFCSNEIVDEFFGYDCPVKRTGSSLSLSCERTRDLGLGCIETVRIDIKGTVTGDTYELWGTFEYSDNPADCFEGSYCDSLHLTFDRLGGVPTACTYADQNTVALNVVSGPQAGAHSLDAWGSSTETSGSFSFNFSASSGGTTAAPVIFAGGVGETIYMNAQTPLVDPAALPATFPVAVLPPLDSGAPAAGGPEVVLYYSEYSPAYQFTAEGATSGNFVVHEIDGDHIAGTLNAIVTGTEYSDANPTGVPAQRTLSGGYYVITSSTPRAADAGAGSPGGLAGGLRRLIR